MEKMVDYMDLWLSEPNGDVFSGSKELCDFLGSQGWGLYDLRFLPGSKGFYEEMSERQSAEMYEIGAIYRVMPLMKHMLWKMYINNEVLPMMSLLSFGEHRWKYINTRCENLDRDSNKNLALQFTMAQFTDNYLSLMNYKRGENEEVLRINNKYVVDTFKERFGVSYLSKIPDTREVRRLW